MTYSELTAFVTGWRAYLVGTRRRWHAHHRFEVSAHRGGHLLGRAAPRVGHLRRAAGLVTEVFHRGGTAWVFGCAGRPGTTPWGWNRPGWRPGALSNYFFARTRRIHFVRLYYRTLRPARVAPRRDRGGDRLIPVTPPPRPDPWWRFTRPDRVGARVVALARGPTAGRLRTSTVRTWWTAATPGGVAPTRPAGPVVARATRTAQVVRRGRPAAGPVRPVRRGGTPAGDTPAVDPPTRPPGRATRRVGRPPPGVPAVVLVGPAAGVGATLVAEVTAAGVPFVRFTGAAARPGGAPVELLWNPAGAAGVPRWVATLAGRARRRAALTVLARRLARLAER